VGVAKTNISELEARGDVPTQGDVREACWHQVEARRPVMENRKPEEGGGVTRW
jgi:hypothetical protein